ncbi:DeoR/GlpR family DNA-binding transcription regulator [Nocardia salmonicida]|uniref:DeoR/GlpR family DNA-binding transcription regulator n=1 Tax=Nocardia salmonicida TaxID=53431 RepID=UPI0037874AF9
MLASTRRREILSRLFAEGYAEAKALASDLGVDISTIRRDLDALERVGQIQRTHGGARPLPGATAELPYATKKAEHLEEKAAIAAAAARRVSDGDTVVLDSGSTTYELAVALREHRGLTIITNDLRIAKYLAGLGEFRLLVAGGELLGSVYTLVGDRTVDFLSDYTADFAFLGADAVDVEAGITNTNTRELAVKRTMLSIARTAIVLADHAKFGRRALSKVAGLGEVDLIITDSGLSDGMAEPFGDLLMRTEQAIPG